MVRILLATVWTLVVTGASAAENSGPGVGDTLPSFTVRGVLDDEAGKTMDLVKDAAGR